MGDFDDRFGGDQNAARLRGAGGQFHQIEFSLLLLAARSGDSQHIDGIGAGSQKFQLAADRTEIVLLVQNKTADGGALAVIFAALGFPVDHAEFGRRVVLAEIVELADEKLLRRQRDHFVRTGFFHTQKAVEFVAGKNVVALDRSADVTVLAVPADLDVVQSGLAAVDLLEMLDLGAAREIFAVFV